jgi:hypothetical protein
VFAFSVPHRDGFLRDFRAAVPATDRTFLTGKNLWIVNAANAPGVESLIQLHFPDLWTTREKSKPPTIRGRPLEAPTIPDVGELFANIFGAFADEAFKKRFRPPPVVAADVEMPADYKTLFVWPTAPIEVIKAAYLALAKIHHPDAGGDPQRFQEIGSAWDRIRRAKS